MKRMLPYGVLAALAGLVGLLVRTAPARMPQGLAGGDILTVLLGDAKKDISSAMLHEADSYFHGGVDMDCHHLHDNDHDHECDHDHEHGHEHGREGEGRAPARPNRGHGFDPWLWINSHIRAPEIDRHLEGDKAVEMMPWFWVAIKADPHNVEAWSAAWYTAADIMKDESLALQIALDGCRENPTSLELACNLGRAYRAETTRNQEQSEAVFHQVLELAHGKKELEDSDELPLCSALGYLANSAKRRNDTQELTVLLDEARRFVPNYPITRTIERMLEE
ncbi:MAG: hypothetical protein J6V72_10525 [Kiritimatiellae bacterium]|nr:hypothetical protein [Kiritimatiellia bacterium]